VSRAGRPLRCAAPARRLACTLAAALIAFGAAPARAADAPLPALNAPVNDFAGVIDAPSAAAIDRMSRSLQAASGDVVVVATVPTVEPYADVREYANKLFENHGRGIGTKGKDNGVLILLAVQQRQVWIEVGYGLEPWVTDGFAGETSRQYMVPEFRRGAYGAGLREGTARLVGRIAQARHVSIEGVPVPPEPAAPDEPPLPLSVLIGLFVAILIASRFRGRRRGLLYWGAGPWSGWSSGVGPFGGGWGRGFGGFGGGRSGGGGGAASW